MGTNSSTPSQIISLPQGGGALHGIGEKFSPDLYTGTGNFTVPLALPPGRNGFQPQLNLVYSTGNGNGPFGLGWSLSIPGVSRKTSKGIPHYDDGKDTFILSGAEDLVPVPGGPAGAIRYRPRTEGFFAHIDHYRDADNNYWKVSSKDGLVSLYGTPGAAGSDPAVIDDPELEKQQHIFAWKLTRTIDPFGNHIDYAYTRDSDESGPHHWDQLYLQQIRYADYVGQRGAEQFLVTVTFDYRPPNGGGLNPGVRPDAFSDYRAGFEIRTRRRCEQIVVETHADADRVVRTYDLSYQNNSPNGVSLLSQIQVVGHDGVLSEALPPITFGFTLFEPEQRHFMPITSPDMPPGSLAHPEQELADLFGNGLPDILEMNGTVRYWRNRGEGRFDLPREMRDAPAGFSLADKGVQLIDANGDGQVDLLITNQAITGYFPLRFDGLWDRKSFQRYQVAPSFDLKDPEVHLVDLDGDGITDAIRSGTRLEYFFNDQFKGWTSKNTRWVERQSLEVFPNVNFSDPRVKWADMTGDSLQDIALVYDGHIEYWPNLGRGKWGKRISMHNCPRFPYGYDPKRILVGDVDGDGLADIVYVDDKKVTLWINQSGNGWSTPVTVEGTPPVTDIDAVRLADLFGSGISGILWSMDANGLSRANMFFLDFTGGVKPYLLNQMDNHMGAVTNVEYAPSTHFYLKDEKRPQTGWKTPLPFPVQVVARVEVIDHLSQGKLTTEYRYHHGYWDGTEREFRGFGMVEQLDTETFDVYHSRGLHGTEMDFLQVKPEHFSPPTLTRTWFHQGPVIPIGSEPGNWGETDFSGEFWSGDPQVLSRPQSMTNFLNGLERSVKRDALRTLRGRTLRTELYTLDGTPRQDRPYTVTEHLHGVASLPVGDPWPAQPEDWRQKVFFPHTLAERTTQWERGDEPMTRFTFTDQYDRYGQAISQISIAVPRGRDFRVATAKSEPYLATHTVTNYAQRDDDNHYFVDRVAGTITYEILNDGSQALFDLVSAITDDTAITNIIGQILNYYDGPAFQGLPFRQLGEYGALVRTEHLVLTKEILHAAYKSGDTKLNPPEEPPYLATDGPPKWTAEYPQEFRDRTPKLAGYTYHPANDGSEYAPGYFVATERRSYDFHEAPDGKGRGMIKVKRDPLGNITTIVYDAYDLLPTEVTNAVHLQTTATYDYRVLQPKEVTEPNGNLTVDRYTHLGLLESTAFIGKNGEGDTLDKPSTRFEYNFMDFIDHGQPISVRTIRRVHHANDIAIPPPERDETIETIEFSDGFGRLLQTRTQAEDVIYDDPALGSPLFGDSGLPPDPSVVPGDAVGKQNLDPDHPYVVVSGWQVYDNKGRVVEKYEPFFSVGWEFALPIDKQFGQKAIMYYDPRGQLIRTVNPDYSEQRVIYGIPADLTNPDLFMPTPWEAYTYDANDNAGRTDPDAALSYRDHWNTPSSIVVDALGRTVQMIERNGSKPATDWYTTRSSYDIRGNLLTVIDPLSRVTFEHVYDLANRALRIKQLDAGVRRTIVDAIGNTLEQRDSKGAIILHAYDPLNRPIRLWAGDNDKSPVNLREQLEYGDNGDHNTNRQANRLGKLYKHYDEAGLLTFDLYDFKGNILEKRRQVINDASILAIFNPGPKKGKIQSILAIFNPGPKKGKIQSICVNWKPPGEITIEQYAQKLLDATSYSTSLTYDSLNRITSTRYPQDIDGPGKRKVMLPYYNRAGALERVSLDGKTCVERIAYNAKGQRTLISYGNSVMTRYAYDRRTFRLLRMRSEHYTKPADFNYRPVGMPLQDIAYRYDLVGNILRMQDRTPGCGVLNNPEATQDKDQQFNQLLACCGLLNNPEDSQVTDTKLKQLLVSGKALLRHFEYDPLYRLRSATGRECKDIPKPREWSDDPRCDFNSGKPGSANQDNAPHLTSIYCEQYMYDPAGNMVSLKHCNNDNSWTRYSGIGGLTPEQWNEAWPKHLNQNDIWQNPPGNRLTHIGDNAPAIPQTHVYNANGDLIQETTSRHFEWDHSDRMRVYLTQTSNTEPSIHAQYLYDTGGQRVKKLVRKQGGVYEATVYIDGIFEHHIWKEVGGITKQNNLLHVMDGQKRIVLRRIGDKRKEDAGPDIQYHLGDHLGSSSVVIDDSGDWINREEYYPYGETSFGSFAKKRYRFTGKERDEESGLYYHGARYYAPWLARWVSCDPLSSKKEASFYVYAANSPLRYHDPAGALEQEGQTDTKDAKSSLVSNVKVVTPGPNTNTVVRMADPTPNPEKVGMSPTDVNAKLSPGEHALNIHKSGPSPYLPASDKLLGASKFEGKRFWIDIEKAKAAGAEFLEHNKIVDDVIRYAKEKNISLSDSYVTKWLKNQINELEVMFKGFIPPEAIESLTTRGLKYLGQGLRWGGYVKTALDLSLAGKESYQTGSAVPLVKESVRQAGGWVGAEVGATAGAEMGAILGIETGPVAVLTAAAGSIIGGSLGFLGVDISTDKFSIEIDKMQTDFNEFIKSPGQRISPAGPW